MKLLKLSFIAIAATFVLGACREAPDHLIAVKPQDRRTAQGSEWQSFSSAVDILFVIDDSGSMNDHQRNLAANMDLFVEGLKENRFIDYHIGAISTAEAEALGGVGTGAGPGAGRLNGRFRFVDRTTPDGWNELKKNVLMGISGSGYEKMFSPTKLALTEPNLSGWNAGFYRPTAFLAVIFITDAEDQSDKSEMGGNKSSNDPLNLSPAGMYDFLVQLKKGNKQKVLTYGSWVPLGIPNSICRWDDGSMPHIRLDEFFRIAKSSTYSLCDANYGQKLGEIGKDLIARIGRRVVLDRRPKSDSISIFYGTQEILPDAESGWSYDPSENAINFGRKIVWTDQPPGTNIEVGFDPIDQ